MTAPKSVIVPTTNAVVTEHRTPQLFLRARLRHDLPAGLTADHVVYPDLHAALVDFAGEYVLEISGREVTVFGDRPLGADQGNRMRAAFELLDTLLDAIERCSERRSGLSSPMSPAAHRSTSGAIVLGGPSRKMGPLGVISITVGLLIVGPILIAVVMSNLDDHLRGAEVAGGVVVSVILFVAFAVVSWVVRLITRRSDTDAPKSWVPRLLGGLVVLALLVVLVDLLIRIATAPSEEDVLNEHCRERIELRDNRIHIDGKPRPDCRADDNGWLHCTKEPEPSYEN